MYPRSLPMTLQSDGFMTWYEFSSQAGSHGFQSQRAILSSPSHFPYPVIFSSPTFAPLSLIAILLTLLFNRCLGWCFLFHPSLHFASPTAIALLHAIGFRVKGFSRPNSVKSMGFFPTPNSSWGLRFFKTQSLLGLRVASRPSFF